MSEKTEDNADQEPAPIKQSDAKRVTSEEANRAEKDREDESGQDSDPSQE